MAKLADGLRDVATPDGCTPAEITAEREGDLLPCADTGGQLHRIGVTRAPADRPFRRGHSDPPAIPAGPGVGSDPSSPIPPSFAER
jgi:hypothetical protein